MKSFMKKVLFFVLPIVCPSLLFGVDIGSDTAVDRFEVQQTLNDGDRIAGFAALEAGFALSGSTVSATFDSFFPVSGEVDLANGELVLGRDFIFRDTSIFERLGDIEGDGHSLEFSASMTRVPLLSDSSDCVFSDLKVFLHANLTFEDCNITFSGDSILNGRGCSLTLGESCTLVIATNSSLLIEDITIKGLEGTKIHCTDSLSTISFHNVELVLDDDYSFTVGKFDVLKDLLIIGDGSSFIYQTDQVSTVSTNGRFILDNGVTFSYDPPVASRELLVLHESTSEFIVNGATLHSTSTGMRLSTGRFIIDRASILSNEGSVDAEAISFASSLDVQWLPAANLDFSQGIIVVE